MSSTRKQKIAADLGSRRLRAVLEISAVVSHARDRRSAAEEILAHVTGLVPYVAASVQAWNPVVKRHETLANAGYSEAAVRHLDGWFVARDEAFRYMQDIDPRPMRWQDMPFDYRGMFSAQAFWIPAGYYEGVTTCLFSPDGRYTGNLHLNTDTRRHPTSEAIDALTSLQPILSGLVDVLRVPGWLAASLAPAERAVVLSAAGHVLQLPGCDPGPYLAGDGPLVNVIRGVIARHRGISGLLWQDPAHGWHAVQLQPIDAGVVVVESPTQVPHDLTPRELDVLTLLAEGFTNAEIAEALVVSVKTVAKHIEHLLEKLDCPSRAAAAARAVREGLVRFADEPVRDSAKPLGSS